MHSTPSLISMSSVSLHGNYGAACVIVIVGLLWTACIKRRHRQVLCVEPRNVSHSRKSADCLSQFDDSWQTLVAVWATGTSVQKRYSFENTGNKGNSVGDAGRRIGAVSAMAVVRRKGHWVWISGRINALVLNSARWWLSHRNMPTPMRWRQCQTTPDFRVVADTAAAPESHIHWRMEDA